MVYTVDPYYGGWFTYTPVISQDYTPIVIKFEAAAIQGTDQQWIHHTQEQAQQDFINDTMGNAADQNDPSMADLNFPHIPIGHKFVKQAANKPNYTMRISPPRSSKRGGKHFLPDSFIVPIGTDGIFRLKLPPSNFYYPFGRYIVEYFRRGSSIPIDVQQWLVPAMPKYMEYSFYFNGSDPQIYLPYYVWNVSSIDPAIEFTASYNQISFIATNLPPNGSGFTAVYEPAATLDQLMEYSVANMRTISRVRR